MKNIIFPCILLLFSLKNQSQQKTIDSLTTLLTATKNDTTKVLIMCDLSYAYQSYKPDTALLIAQRALTLAGEKTFLKGQSRASDAMAGAFQSLGDNAHALEYYLKCLKINEQRKLPGTLGAENAAAININIANVYINNDDTTQAVQYIIKADSIVEKFGIDYLRTYVYLNTGNIFEKTNRLEDALVYTYKCYNLAEKDSLMLGSCLNNMGNIFLKMGDRNKAISSYVKSYPYLYVMQDNKSITEGYLGMAKAYKEIHKIDSSLFFAKRAFFISQSNGILDNALQAGEFITKHYKEINNKDSSFFYQDVVMGLKDSLNGIDKVKQLESLSLNEELRQQQIAARLAKEKEEAKQFLQLLVIGIFIPLFFFLSIYISKRKVNRKIIQFSGILSLLLLFEYITLILHPIVVEITHHSPLLEILIFVLIASLMVPAHHKIEKWFIRRLSMWRDKHLNKPFNKTER